MAAAHDTGELLTKNAAARLLGVSERRIRQFRDTGKLRTTRTSDGVHLYERSQLTRLAIERANSADPRVHRKGVPSILAARVFELFDNGWTLSQIVQETQQAPDVVRALYVEYSTPLGERPRLATAPADDVGRHDRLMDRFAADQERRRRAEGDEP